VVVRQALVVQEEMQEPQETWQQVLEVLQDQVVLVVSEVLPISEVLLAITQVQ
jgi:acetone carboxylase gamma subunit